MAFPSHDPLCSTSSVSFWTPATESGTWIPFPPSARAVTGASVVPSSDSENVTDWQSRSNSVSRSIPTVATNWEYRLPRS